MKMNKENIAEFFRMIAQELEMIVALFEKDPDASAEFAAELEAAAEHLNCAADIYEGENLENK